MDIDLNINNYSLEDILKLFKIQNNFNEEDMKKAKKQVLMMHPDKSKLDKKYFLFFSSAYRLLHKVYNFRVRSEQNTNINRTYKSVDIDDEQDNAEIWKSLSKHSQFNDIFNELFDKNIAQSKTTDGYGEWLKEEDKEVEQVKSRDDMNNFIDARKKSLRSIIEYKEVSDVGGYSGTELVGEGGSYKSGMFSTLQFDDIKQVYTESVIPVSDEDYQNKEKYQSVDHLQRMRREVINESTKYHNNHTKQMNDYTKEEEKKDASRAYSLAKQDEEMRMLRNKIATNFLRITHK